MDLSPDPTEAEIEALRLLVPGGFEIAIEGRRLHLLYRRRVPLVRFVLAPATPAADFSGDIAGLLIEDLAATFATSYRAIAPGSATSDERIDDIVKGTVEAVVERHGERQLTVTPELFTMHEEDWFSA
jgi:hypothetical protein